jgi:hypothetical protein
MTDRFPNILGIIEEVADGGYVVTVYHRTAPGGDGTELLADQPADTLEEARGIIGLVARGCLISDDDVEIGIRLALSPPRGPMN